MREITLNEQVFSPSNRFENTTGKTHPRKKIKMFQRHYNQYKIACEYVPPVRDVVDAAKATLARHLELFPDRSPQFRHIQ